MAGLRGGLGSFKGRAGGKNIQATAAMGGREGFRAMNVGDLSEIGAGGTPGQFGRSPSDSGMSAFMGNIHGAGPSVDQATATAASEDQEETAGGGRKRTAEGGYEASLKRTEGGGTDRDAPSQDASASLGFGSRMGLVGMGMKDALSAAYSGYSGYSSAKSRAKAAALGLSMTGKRGMAAAMGVMGMLGPIGMIGATVGLARGMRGLESEMDARMGTLTGIGYGRGTQAGFFDKPAITGYEHDPDDKSLSRADLESISDRAPSDLSKSEDIAETAKDMAKQGVPHDKIRGWVAKAHESKKQMEQRMHNYKVKQAMMELGALPGGYASDDPGINTQDPFGSMSEQPAWDVDKKGPDTDSSGRKGGYSTEAMNTAMSQMDKSAAEDNPSQQGYDSEVGGYGYSGDEDAYGGDQAEADAPGSSGGGPGGAATGSAADSNTESSQAESDATAASQADASADADNPGGTGESGSSDGGPGAGGGDADGVGGCGGSSDGCGGCGDSSW